MAKGTHNKTHKRNQGIIRRLMQDKVFTPRTNATHERLLKRTLGQGDDSLITRKKNAFRYPNDPSAVFPQEEKPTYIDRRRASLPVEYLKKDIYEKQKNKYARERDEKLKNELLKIEGKFNEGKNIELNDMEDIDMDEDGGTMHTVKYSMTIGKDILCWYKDGYHIGSGNDMIVKMHYGKGFADIEEVIGFVRQPVFEQSSLFMI